ncbi:hypothetical protein CN470_15830 [Bacillus cereus]|nr:hypothetical protein BCAH1134_C0592 [Bacillus cereus AH1134]PEQ61079.1 hypothetical protein CN470_15830 [Bacillus cereus]PET54745.1 hypothetical protein CN536_30430 [Bacillus cereus]PFA42365.1 hypothetical protein CN381_21915 [Bacillus cereus]
MGVLHNFILIAIWRDSFLYEYNNNIVDFYSYKNKKRRGISPSPPTKSNIFTIKEGHTFIK